jgi:tripartite-type tricarboxylate transporter receptor subunit TctC
MGEGTAMMKKIMAAAAVAVAVVGLSGTAAQAQSYPTHPVKMIVPFPPGGATDMIARLIGQKLQDIWGQNVVLDYKPGAGTVIGTDVVAKAPPDGYTLGMVITAHVINPSMRPDLPYDTLKYLQHVSMVAVSDLVLVATNSLPVENLKDVVEYAKKNPGKLSYASPGTGTAMHLGGELLKSQTGIDIVHVPYRGGAPAYPDIITGRIQLMFDTLYAIAQNIDTKQVKPIAVMSPTRAATHPNIPTFAETLPGFNVVSISGIVAPGGTPKDVVNKISRDINKALQSSDLKQRMSEVGMGPHGTTPEQFEQFVRAEMAKWANVVKTSGAKLD